MDKIFEINSNFLLSATHLVRTEKGLVETQRLKDGDAIVGMKGLSKIVKIIKFKAKSNDSEE